MTHGTSTPQAQPTRNDDNKPRPRRPTAPLPPAALDAIARLEAALAPDPLGDLVSADAIHTNPAASAVREWMTVDVAMHVSATADRRVIAAGYVRRATTTGGAR